jgi:hypothetical protein
MAAFVACDDESTAPDVCRPGEQSVCYEGPAGTEGVGTCSFGVRTCTSDGAGYSECLSQILPTTEQCGTALDDDCDGEVNEDCECVPGTFQSCYTGPAGTYGVGQCVSGTAWCSDDGVGLDACQGEVLPAVEDCATLEDEDCDGVVNQPDACVCAPGEVAACYPGPDGTEGVGICVAGEKTCGAEGGVFGECDGAILPGQEDCDTDEDDDCNGLSNEPAAGCTCSPGEERSCFSGPAAANGVGKCVAGTQVCEASGDGFGPCSGDVVPVAENCGTPEDDDCDGEVNEEAAGCECTPGAQELCYTGPPFTLDIGTCTAGMRTCAPSGLWFACHGDIVPVDDDCATPLDENCDGSVNEPSSGCSCFLEDVLTLESEDCVLDYGETAWRMPIAGMPHELVADAQGNGFMLLRREKLNLDFEPVPSPMVASAVVARHAPNGDLFWGKELTGQVLPELGYANSYNMSVTEGGLVAFTAPTGSGNASAFGADTWTWPASAFRLLYLVDPFGLPIFAAAVPRYGTEPNNAIHAIAASETAGVFYANGPLNTHLHHFDFDGAPSWTVDFALGFDDLALAATDGGGVLMAFTTNVTIDLGELPLPPLAGSTSDLVVVRFDADGDVMWAVRPLPAAAVFSARQEDGVLGIVAQTSLVRLDVFDGSLISADPLPGAVVPSQPFALAGADAVVYALNGSSGADFGLGFVDPYGGMASGPFVALRAVGETRWARAPLADHVFVGGGAANNVLAAFRATTEIDLDGTLVPLADPTVFLARLAY